VKRKYVVILSIIALIIAVSLYANVHENPLPSDVTADQIVVEKSNRKLLLMKKNKVIKKYEISLGRNPNGRKEKQGDFKTPEGTYIIDYRNPNSKYHLSLHISYPNEKDKKFALAQGVSPGGDIMIHGIRNGLGLIGRLHTLFDWTQGCIAVTNPEIKEIWNAVPKGTKITIKP
jgi:murein L,D-transpeptidase YafK